MGFYKVVDTQSCKTSCFYAFLVRSRPTLRVFVHCLMRRRTKPHVFAHVLMRGREKPCIFRFSLFASEKSPPALAEISEIVMLYWWNYQFVIENCFFEETI